MSPPLISFDRRVWGLFALALVLRLAFVAYHASMGWQLRFDPGMYLSLAQHMDNGVFSMFHPLDIPDTIKMPGYPGLIWLLGGKMLVVLMFQVILSAVKVPLVFLLATRVGLRPIFSLAAAALMAVEPMDIMLSGQVLTEATFTLLLLCGTLMLLHRGPRRSLLLAAVLFAAASWVRPNGIWLILLAGIIGGFYIHRSPSGALVFITLGLLLLAPWAMRNQSALGRFYLGDSGAVAAAYYQVPHVLRAAEDPLADAWSRALHQRAAAIDWEDRDQFHAFFDGLRTDVYHTLHEHPFTWLRVHGWKSLKIFMAPGRGHIQAFFGTKPLVNRGVLALSAVFSLMLLLSALGWLVSLRQVPPWLWAFLILSAYLIIAGALTTTDARFKNPAMPLLLIGAAWLWQISPWSSKVGEPVRDTA